MKLAQWNVGRSLYPVDDPHMAEFTGRLELINALAERSPGFVWRLKDDNADIDGATDLRLPGDDTMLVNMSVWDGIESLYQFVYKTAHAKVMRDRLDWFEPQVSQYAVLWWVPDGHVPTLEEARDRLSMLEKSGPSPQAFTFNMPFDSAGQPVRPSFPQKDCA